MFINKDSIKVDGVSWGKYLVEVKYEYPKLWSSDTGRNLAGTMKGTLKGIFPKFILYFGELSKTEIELIAPKLDAPSQQFTYYDPNKKVNKTITTYTGDWGFASKGILENEPFNISFISTKKRI